MREGLPVFWGVDQEGFLLFASSSIRSMPGGTKLRKALGMVGRGWLNEAPKHGRIHQ